MFLFVVYWFIALDPTITIFVRLIESISMTVSETEGNRSFISIVMYLRYVEILINMLYSLHK